MLKVTSIQHQERPHQHRLRHLQRTIAELLQYIILSIKPTGFYAVCSTLYTDLKTDHGTVNENLKPLEIKTRNSLIKQNKYERYYRPGRYALAYCTICVR